MSLLPLWIPGSVRPSVRPDENTLPKPSRGRVIPRWNRLDKRKGSMKKNPASHARRARSALKRVTLTK